jgi:hypothetical protein
VSHPGRGSEPSQRASRKALALMDQLLIERVKELECEVAEIAVASHAYLASGTTDLSEQLLHERRLERLQEINEELAALHQKQALTRQQEEA